MNFLDIINSLSNDNNNKINVKFCDGCNVITDKLDFSKREDLERLKEAVSDLKNSNNSTLNFVKSYMGIDEFNNTLDDIVNSAQNIYNKSNKKTELTDNTITRKEIDKSEDNNTKPSYKVSEELQKQIGSITYDYLKNIIIPNANLTKQQLDSIYEGLFEFACWIYAR